MCSENSQCLLIGYSDLDKRCELYKWAEYAKNETVRPINDSLKYYKLIPQCL